MKYRVRKHIEDKDVEALDKATGYGAEFCRLLLMRGINSEQKAEKFLNPTLSELTPAAAIPNIGDAVKRIESAVENDETIIIYGDYDCDGIAATAILYDCLSSKLSNVYYYIPDRAEDGYGLNVQTLETLAEEYLPDLLITVDCGITSCAEIELLQQEMGIDVIVTDHHEAGSVVPDCIIVDPKISKTGFFELCGAGLALRLAEALYGGDCLPRYIEAAAIATVADCVPLIGDNRIIVAEGLKSLAKPSSKGLALLVESLALKRKINASDIAFKIAPRINSIGRLDNANAAVELFFGEDYFELKVLTEQLNAFNEERQRLCDRILEECLSVLEDYDLSEKRAIVLEKDDWDSGVLGIVCSKLTEIFYRPALLFSKDKNGLYKGSARSIDGVNLYESVRECGDLLAKFGGHSMACGMSVSPEKFELFRQRLESIFSEFDSSVFVPSEKYDIITEKVPNLEFADKLEKLQPFGVGNPSVKFVLEQKACNFEVVASNHLKYRLKNGTELMYFNAVAQRALLNSSAIKRFSIRFSSAEFANIRYAQGIIDDVDYVDAGGVSDEYFAAHYLKQLFVEGDSITKNEAIDWDSAIKFVEENIYGTCFLCYTKDTFIRFCDEIEKRGLSERIYSALGNCGKNPINSVILDADKTTNLSYFDRVIYLDLPLEEAYSDYLKTSRKCRFYAMKNFGKKVDFHCPDYAALGTIFLNLKKVMTVKKRSVDDVYEAVNKLQSVSYSDFFIAFCSFCDLKIIKSSENGFFIDGTIKTKLADSKFYNKVKALAE